MMDNRVISKWLGECRHELDDPYAYRENGTMHKCKCCGLVMFMPFHIESPNPDYENDPAAWTPALFDRIEEAGLEARFMGHLMPKCFPDCPNAMLCNFVDWLEFRSTPAQKSAALAKAIQEVE